MRKASYGRFALLLAAVINYILNYFGYSPITEDLINDGITFISGAYFLYMGWKNNYLSKKGEKQKEVLDMHRLS